MPLPMPIVPMLPMELVGPMVLMPMSMFASASLHRCGAYRAYGAYGACACAYTVAVPVIHMLILSDPCGLDPQASAHAPMFIVWGYALARLSFG